MCCGLFLSSLSCRGVVPVRHCRIFQWRIQRDGHQHGCQEPDSSSHRRVPAAPRRDRPSWSFTWRVCGQIYGNQVPACRWLFRLYRHRPDCRPGVGQNHTQWVLEMLPQPAFDASCLPKRPTFHQFFLSPVPVLFVILYGLLASVGNFGPGSCLGLVSSESYPTALRGTAYGLSAAIGKVGAVVGTEIFKPVQDNVGKKCVDGRGAYLLKKRLCAP